MDRARLLVEHLKYRRDLGETEMFVGAGEREALLSRAARLARGENLSRGDGGRIPTRVGVVSPDAAMDADL
ncbi:MAG: hypothetical protein ACWGON_09570, partial [Gemmatimonadota bacterium]